MSKWRSRLLSYTGVALVLGLWSPVVWFISEARESYGMVTFEISRMPPISIAMFLILLLATLLAQFGFVIVAHDLGEYEKMRAEPDSDSF